MSHTNAKTPGSAGAPPRPWLRAVGTVASVVLGAILLVAAYGKALDSDAFSRQITLEGLDFLLPATGVALIALALEAGLGTALLLGLRRLWVLIPTAGLVLFFLFLTGRNYYLTANGLRSEEEACGCFGSLVERTPAEAFWQDLFLLGVPIVLAFVGRQAAARGIGWRSVTAGAAAVAGLLFGWASPRLPLDDLATRLSPGVEIAELCAGAEDERICLDLLAPELTMGDHLVILSELESPALTESMQQLNGYSLDAMNSGAPQLFLLNPDPPEKQRPFYWKWGPTFEVREAPPGLLQGMYRRLPRSFAVQDGTVTETWAGLPPQIGASKARQASTG